MAKNGLSNTQDQGFSLMKKSINNLFEQKEAQTYNTSLEEEQILMQIVESGNIDRIKEIEFARTIHHPGVLSDNPLRNAKNLFIATVTLLTRAAIRGGVEAQTAFQVSDQYIQQAEKTNSIPKIDALEHESIYTFTRLVSEAKTHVYQNASMMDILNYVRLHSNHPLTVAHVAKKFSYNPDYLSHKFHQELGFGLSQYIMRVRLEESRQLLLYTKKSLLEISTYLCFSSQNHFQAAFKKQYGITPGKFRRQESRSQSPENDRQSC